MVAISEIPTTPSFELTDARYDFPVYELDSIVGTVREYLEVILNETYLHEATVPFLVERVNETEVMSEKEIHSGVLELIDEGLIEFDAVTNILQYAK